MSDNSFDIGKAAKNLHDLQKVGEAMGLAAGQRAEGAEAGCLKVGDKVLVRGEVEYIDESSDGTWMGVKVAGHKDAMEFEPNELLRAAPPVAEKTELGQAGRGDGVEKVPAPIRYAKDEPDDWPDQPLSPEDIERIAFNQGVTFACMEIEHQANLRRNSEIESFLVSLAVKIRKSAELPVEKPALGSGQELREALLEKEITVANHIRAERDGGK